MSTFEAYDTSRLNICRIFFIFSFYKTIFKLFSKITNSFDRLIIKKLASILNFKTEKMSLTPGLLGASINSSYSMTELRHDR